MDFPSQVVALISSFPGCPTSFSPCDDRRRDADDLVVTIGRDAQSRFSPKDERLSLTVNPGPTRPVSSFVARPSEVHGASHFDPPPRLRRSTSWLVPARITARVGHRFPRVITSPANRERLLRSELLTVWWTNECSSKAISPPKK